MDELSFVPKLSLEEMALRRTVINVWTEPEVLASIEDLRSKLHSGRRIFDIVDEIKDATEKTWQWEDTNKKGKAKILELQLPTSLKKRMLNIYRHIGSEMLRWRLLFCKTHLNDSEMDSDVHIQQLCWTSVGAIDYLNTVKKLVCLETLDVVTRFKLACLYCLEEQIPTLWERLPEENKNRDYNNRNVSDTLAHLEFYWIYIMKGDRYKQYYNFFSGTLESGSSVHKRLFEVSARGGEKAATEYFFQKLTEEERDSVLFELACTVAQSESSKKLPYEIPKEKYSDVLCYLLSVMTPAQKMRLFNEHPCSVLKCLLDWPYQDLFLDIADIIWTFLPKSSYHDLLKTISEKIVCTGYYAPKLLQEFFLRSPSGFKRLFAFSFESFFSTFSCVPDTETFKLVFRNLKRKYRAELVTSSGFSKLLYFFIKRYNWHIVKVCLQEVLHSKEDKARFIAASGSLFAQIHFRDGLYGSRRLERLYELLRSTKVTVPANKIKEPSDKDNKLCKEAEKDNL